MLTYSQVSGPLGAARDDLIDTLSSLPLIDKAKATLFVEQTEATVEERVKKVLIPVVVGLGALSLIGLGSTIYMISRTKRFAR